MNLRDILQRDGMTATNKLVLIAIATYSHEINPSIQFLSDICSVSKTTIKKAVRELEELQLIECDRQYRKFIRYRVIAQTGAVTDPELGQSVAQLGQSLTQIGSSRHLQLVENSHDPGAVAAPTGSVAGAVSDPTGAVAGPVITTIDITTTSSILTKTMRAWDKQKEFCTARNWWFPPDHVRDQLELMQFHDDVNVWTVYGMLRTWCGQKKVDPTAELFVKFMRNEDDRMKKIDREEGRLHREEFPVTPSMAVWNH